ncbi:MAG TPA: hypothetical protein ENN29_01755 [Candidatus Hydrogenedentes bacterium]|nr:hypothetical protein [Candidatus Hydrogenedentota bacterium]
MNGEKAKGKAGYILIKANHLTDTGVIRRLRDAADAGVRIHLIIRTTYAVTPHQNIKAISILDRFLEHQRIYVFGKDDDAKVYMSSADLMERNLDWRVEAAFPVLDPLLRRVVLDMAQIQIRDNSKARRLDRLQSNKYVLNRRGIHRTQYETYAYFGRLTEKKR